MSEQTAHPTGAARTPLETLEEVRRCAAGWDPEARLIGNVRAGDIVSALTRLTERNRALEVDAERWRALLSSARIRILGHGHLGMSEAQHLGLELWECYPTREDRGGAAVITRYADAIREHQRARRALDTEAPHDG